MRAGEKPRLCRNPKRTGGWAPRHEDQAVWEVRVALIPVAVGPANEDGDSMTAHILHGVAVEWSGVRDPCSSKVPRSVYLSKRAPKQLVEDVRAVYNVTRDDVFQNSGRCGGVFVE